MKHVTQIIPLESTEFPFRIFDGNGCTENEVFLHNHDCLELNYVVRGTGTYLIGNNRYPIKQGDLFVINNCEYHIAVNQGDLLLKVIVFQADMVWQSNSTLDYKYLQTFYEWKDNFKHRFVADDLMVKHIATVFYEIEYEWNCRQEGYRLVIKALLLKMLSLLYRGFAQKEETAQKVLQFQTDYNRIVDALLYIDENYRNHIDLVKLADLTHLSPNYFSRVFNNVMSTSVSNYINRKRIIYAYQLLDTTQMIISEIALKAGFNDISHFNKVFKSFTHMSPKEYRAK